MPNKNIVLHFRTTEEIKQLVELTSKKNGQSKSEFFEAVVVDTSLNFEELRTVDTLTDFLKVSLPFLTQGMEEKEANEIKQKLGKLQTEYIKDRLRPQKRIQKHLTNIAIRSYLQDYTEDWDLGDKDGFIINQCLQAIYDHLGANGIITPEEWTEKSQAYELYMQEQKII